MSLSVDIKKKYKKFELSVKLETIDTTIGILGASGCGKSMTLKAIAGIINPDTGRIILNGRTLFDSENKINLPPRKRKIGYLFQNYALFPNMTVEQNIQAGMNTNEYNKKLKVKDIVERFHLNGLEKQYPGQLSGGQQQRVALARIMVSDTEAILLDEPFSALDYYLKEQLEEQLLVMIRDYKKDVILVTHNRNEVFRFCSDLYIMNTGHMVCSGKLQDIFQNPGYVTAARLTGCKNISRAEKISEHELYAIEWDVTLSINQKIPDDINYVGIRAHYLKAVSDGMQKNLIQPELVEVIEDPFEINLVINNKHRSTEYENKIWWKLSKNEWFVIYNGKLPDYVQFPPEHIVLLR